MRCLEDLDDFPSLRQVLRRIPRGGGLQKRRALVLCARCGGLVVEGQHCSCAERDREMAERERADAARLAEYRAGMAVLRIENAASLGNHPLRLVPRGK